MLHLVLTHLMDDKKLEEEPVSLLPVFLPLPLFVSPSPPWELGVKEGREREREMFVPSSRCSACRPLWSLLHPPPSAVLAAHHSMPLGVTGHTS